MESQNMQQNVFKKVLMQICLCLGLADIREAAGWSER